MAKVKVGIIGAGGIAAKLHIPGLQEVADAEVVVVGGRKQSRLDTLKSMFHISRTTRDYEEILSDSAVDAVLIALPHPLHVKWGLKVLGAGKHLFMEKPLCTDFSEAQGFVEAAEGANLTVLALPFLDRSELVASASLVQNGTLGKVSSAHSRASHGGPEGYYASIQKLLGEQSTDDLWFFDADRADGGALVDMGVYAIANLVAILGSVKQVSAFCTTITKPTTLEDTAALLLEFASGAIGTVETGWCDGARTREFSIHGATGKLEHSVETGKLFLNELSPTADEDAQPTRREVDLTGFPATTMHSYWIDCIRRGVQPALSNVRSALHVTEVMLAGLESAAKSRPIPVASRL